MSIASEITRLQTSKADSKAQINIDKDIINDGIDFINDEKVDSYNEKIAEMQEAYKQYIPINSTSDTQIETPKGGVIIGKTIKGNIKQNGTPTPSTPIPVNNVTGEQVVKVCRKNLFDLESAYHSSINASGVVASNESYRTTLYIPTTPNTNYYFSTTQISGQTSKQIYIAYYDNNKNFLSRPSYNLYESAFTTPNNCCYMRAGVYSAGQENIMLELGSTKTTYEPYQGKDYEINLGKNLLDQSKLRQGAFHGRGNVHSRLFINSNYYISSGTYTFFSNWKIFRLYVYYSLFQFHFF